MTASLDPKLLAQIEAQAQGLLAQGKAQESIDLLDRAGEDLSGFPTLYKLKGVARLLQGSNTEARLIFEEVEGSFGDDPAFLNVYGVALRREKDLRRAKEVYTRALEISPEEPSVLSNLGNLLIDLGSLKEARVHLEKALAIDPSHRDAHQNLARLNTQAGAASDSLSEQSKAASSAQILSAPSLDDDEAAADWLKLASIAQRDGNSEEALVFARKAISHSPSLSPAYKLAGEVLAGLKRFESAEQALLYGILLGDGDANSLTNLGCICAQRGQYSLARLLLSKALAMQPEHKAAKINLDLVSSKTKGKPVSFGSTLI